MKKTTKQLKDKLWKLTSEYVRRRDADENDIVPCCTCGKTGHWKTLQAGHFIPSARGNSTRWDLTNIHPQCFRCNVNLSGNGAVYYQYIEKRYGSGHADKLIRQANQTLKISNDDYLDRIEFMKERLRLLDERY